MRFNVTTARLIWSITSLLFAVKGQKTAKVWLFLCRLDLRKAGVSAAESSSLAVFLLQTTAKTVTTPKVFQWAPPQAVAVNSMVRSDLFRRLRASSPPHIGHRRIRAGVGAPFSLRHRLHLPRAPRRGDLPVQGPALAKARDGTRPSDFFRRNVLSFQDDAIGTYSHPDPPPACGGGKGRGRRARRGRAANRPICAMSHLTSCAWQLRGRRRLQRLLRS